ncbi:DUF739 family protein [Streptobacillus moniliformis]|uniref:DUF739 family protein n=1 Tax=Streptobacillus moniliformis (strain ATCC 14647 / DSM 12112 / NCTC 10651 / 9901) TaxID=519441 RepID=D1AYJ5_STRM9|nr:DUF739 family protein [Streptobacillus moniliformis]ACZ01371.1 hypothetical protein Smon_0905 [Streptobacillus moniliformis DSM 12112]AVL43614.1 DUF739 domain-containing protein [Streptobacillus moniliformis]SQA13469.1 Uncharacterised protein [Streptobacillus moniliformis]SQA14552.1 Uncharacterised protein [Streptobacillus moniliformis]SQA14560.1 Uncharacterised protein [Streptobacillus moniliformis]
MKKKNFKYSQLKGRILQLYDSVDNFCSVTGMKKCTIYNKMNNISNFNSSEILIMIKHLSISKNQIYDYFFMEVENEI